MIHQGEHSTYQHHKECKYIGYGSSGGLNNQRILRLFYDYNDWGYGGALVTLRGWYYSPATGHSYQRYFVSAGYGDSTSLHTLDNVGSGATNVEWTGSTQASGDVYWRDFICDIPAYVYLSAEVEVVTYPAITTDLNNVDNSRIWIG